LLPTEPASHEIYRLRRRLRERAVRHKSAGPEKLIDLAFQKRSGTALGEQLQELKGLEREVNGLASK